MKLHFKSGERFFINGAVLRFTSKAQIELLNDAEFLLESHIIQPENTTTPLKQLYFVIQTSMIDKKNDVMLKNMIEDLLVEEMQVFENEKIRAGLTEAAEYMKKGRLYVALKILRDLFPIENRILRDDADVKHQAILSTGQTCSAQAGKAGVIETAGVTETARDVS